ncbi:MAG: XRE family transcriptional regulator [Comamonadaceae bacterium]|nr:MAG: XRE family transcriptional regulator [Comamonadaceae bacterium]
MPAQAPVLQPAASVVLGGLGASIRDRRKTLRVSASTAAEAAGMSRVTLHRIERGEASVTMGAYANAMAALGVQIRIVDAATGTAPVAQAEADIPAAAIRLADHTQLRQLAWHLPDAAELTPEEALGLYERNWRHIDQAAVSVQERALIDRLVATLGQGQLLV